MKHHLLFTVVSAALFCGCGNSNNSNSAAKESSDSLTIAVVDTNYIPKNLIGATVVTRMADPSNPPAEIDLRNPNSNYTQFNLADYFKRASVKVLEFPADSGSFVKDKKLFITYHQGGQSLTDITKVRNIEGNYLVFDLTNGIFMYDSLGNYSGTVYKNNLSGLKYDKRYKWHEIQIDRWNTFSISSPIQKNITYLVKDSLNHLTINFWNPKQKKNILQQRIQQGHPLLYPGINDTVYYCYKHTAFKSQGEPIMLYFLNEKGDTLSKVPDYIRLNKILKRNYTGSADPMVQYHFNGNNYFRQPYSDTLFKIISSKEIRPTYLLQFGDKKPTMDIGYYGDKSNYFMLQNWVETKNIILITYSKNYDCPNTRDEKSISFYYAVYDKQTNKLSYLDMKGAYPEEAWIKNTLPMSLPISVDQFITTRDGKVHIRYFKEDLEKIIQSPVFKELSTAQKELIEQLAEELDSRKIAVMTLEPV